MARTTSQSRKAAEDTPVPNEFCSELDQQSSQDKAGNVTHHLPTGNQHSQGDQSDHHSGQAVGPSRRSVGQRAGDVDGADKATNEC